MGNSYFQFRQFRVDQDRTVMKVGTDGVLLGAWARGGKRIIDIGAGTGLIALMMAQRFSQAAVTGVEIDHEAVLQARENVANSPFSDRVKLVECDVAAFHPSVRFDAVVSNPPFFVNALRNPDSRKAMARHADVLTFGQLLFSARELLTPEGEFSVIIPREARESFESEALAHGLWLWRECEVQTTHRKPPRRHLLAFRGEQCDMVEREKVVLESSTGVRSPWYEQLTRDFYLPRV